MDILAIFNDKVKEIGLDEVAKALGIPKGIAKQFSTGKKTPGYKSCQEILNLWGNGQNKEVDAGLKEMVGAANLPDGSTFNISEDNGALNLSYSPPEWGTKKAAWEGRDVCLCLPIMANIPAASFFCFMALAMKYRMGLRLELRSEDSDITRSRNHLAKRFLDTGASWSIWIDSDMVVPFGHSGIYMTMTNMRNIADKFLGTHVIERLISWDKTMVGGCYWDRRGGGKLIAGGTQAILNPIPSDALHPLTFVGTGCLAAKRQVFLDIAEKFPDTLHPDSMGNECGFFTQIQTPQRMLGEDESFAKRATDAGHPTYLDLGLICGHVGQAMIHGIPASGSKM